MNSSVLSETFYSGYSSILDLDSFYLTNILVAFLPLVLQGHFLVPLKLVSTHPTRSDRSSIFWVPSLKECHPTEPRKWSFLCSSTCHPYFPWLDWPQPWQSFAKCWRTGCAPGYRSQYFGWHQRHFVTAEFFGGLFSVSIIIFNVILWGRGCMFLMFFLAPPTMYLWNFVRWEGQINWMNEWIINKQTDRLSNMTCQHLSFLTEYSFVNSSYWSPFKLFPRSCFLIVRSNILAHIVNYNLFFFLFSNIW